MVDIHSESEFEAIIENLLCQTKSLDLNERLLVGVCGVAGSGKTFISNKITKLLNERSNESKSNFDIAVCLSMDGFHYTKQQLLKFKDPELAIKRRGAHWTFDAHGFVNKVIQLKYSKNIIYFPSFDHAKGDPVFDSILVDKNIQIVIIEGLYTCMTNIEPWNQLSGVWDQTWYIKPKDQAKTLNRLAQRHVKSGIEPNIESALQRIESNDNKNAETIIQNIPSKFNYVIYN
ncbi:hypothetical protein BB561_006005 [Smittium simulii]|uniref:Phosphoribulokinase/uridine kinase domain-containing protein n=1 Tax=Smittium simulii TaxID=133385 RepID=A0A2T9Y751_9FUNG|nr:hypothetical protein BB561_006005 [Smittium simulii]